MAILLGLLAVIIAGGRFGGDMNSNPPEYIQSIHLGKDGSDGISTYFALGDKQSASTASDGKLILNIADEKGALLNFTHDVAKSDFIKTTNGMGGGNFAHPVVLMNIGHIPYSAMTREPIGSYLKVIISFITVDGQTFSGDAKILL